MDTFLVSMHYVLIILLHFFRVIIFLFRFSFSILLIPLHPARNSSRISISFILFFRHSYTTCKLRRFRRQEALSVSFSGTQRELQLQIVAASR